MDPKSIPPSQHAHLDSIQVITPFYSQVSFCATDTSPLRGGHVTRAQPISLFHPFGPDWLMGRHMTQARPGRLNSRVWLEYLEREAACPLRLQYLRMEAWT